MLKFLLLNFKDLRIIDFENSIQLFCPNLGSIFEIEKYVRIDE